MTKWLILLGVILLICIAEWMREIFTFKVTHYDITSEKLNTLMRERKILFLSDLHSNRYGKDNERLLKAIRVQKPDMIFIGGDMVVGVKNAPCDVAEALMEQLVNICPVYYANGNHEQRMKLFPNTYGDKYAQYKEHLESLGVQFLENSYVDLRWDNCPMRIYGLEIPNKNYKKFYKTELSVETVRECIGQADLSKYQILLAHNPLYADTYVDWGADLVLSGHLHGGVVRLPGLGGVITPQFRFFPKYSGELTKKGKSFIVVSKGLGTHTIKIRFLNSAELVVLHMKNSGGTHGNTCEVGSV